VITPRLDASHSQHADSSLYLVIRGADSRQNLHVVGVPSARVRHHLAVDAPSQPCHAPAARGEMHVSAPSPPFTVKDTPSARSTHRSSRTCAPRGPPARRRSYSDGPPPAGPDPCGPISTSGPELRIRGGLDSTHQPPTECSPRELHAHAQSPPVLKGEVKDKGGNTTTAQSRKRGMTTHPAL
jgi:hypothetical protein